MRTPVLVVGAGPAGATAALTLRRAGIPVRLLDRAAFPRNKPCGGAISLRALRRFGYLERALPRIATHQISRLHLEGPGGESATLTSDGPAALMIRRLEFDALLVSLAVEAGAELVTGADIVSARMDDAGVELTARDGRRFGSDLVIAADGVHSVVGRRLGINPGWPDTSVAIDMMEEAPRSVLRDIDPSTLWVAYGFDPPQPAGGGSVGGRSSEGYAYIFPKQDHVNVGIGYVLRHFRESIDMPPYTLQRTFVDYLRRRGLVDGESRREHFTPFIIPVGGPLPRPGRGRVLLAGDAGGFVNGFTAEGIYYAMVSGDLAGRAVSETTPATVGSMAARYRRACEAEVGAELRDSVLIQRYLFADRSRIGQIVSGAARSPEMANLVVDYFVGRTSYQRTRRRILAAAPAFALRLCWEWARAKASGTTGERPSTATS